MGKVPFSSDDFAWKLAEHLLEDMASALEETFYTAVLTHVRCCNIEGIRKLKARFTGLTVTQLKAEYQICSLFKKYVFRKDLHEPADVLRNSERKFRANQDRLDGFTFPDPARVSFEWRIRDHASRMLGSFNEIEHLEKCAFGRRSSVGIPFSEACEGARYDGPLTGSLEHIVWFQHRYGVYNRPAALYAAERAVILKLDEPFKRVFKLEAVLVDKTWNSKRMIIPNTTIGSLYSSGLGRVMQSRLKDYGYDITMLQRIHGDLAKRGSISSDLVTADQSLASDNITSEHIDRFFPYRWAEALKFGRIGKLCVNSRVQESRTFCTMGIGFTFPLQTALFLSLLLAIRDHLCLGEDTVVSVYGDDLIYDKRMHDLVVETFTTYGLIINNDKTFADGFFRESCGSDYYHGFDVRPFHLGMCGNVKEKSEVLAFLYKTINGLNRRWSSEEIPNTLRYVYGIARDVREGKPLHAIPVDFPDTAGVRSTSFDPIWFEKPVRDIHGTYRFKYLGFVPDTRLEDREQAYLFLSLRRAGVEDKLATLALSKVKPRLGIIYEESTPVLKLERDPWLVASVVNGRKRYSMRPTIVKNDCGHYREQSGKTFSRFAS